jgi:hypothetical protein
VNAGLRHVRQVRQVDAERFEVVEVTGLVTEVTLRRDTRSGLGLHGVAPSAIVAEAVAMLEAEHRWPPVVGGSIDAIGLLAAAPGALEDLRARLSA